MDFIKTIFQDLRMMIASPRLAFEEMLAREDWKLDRAYLVFILLMHSYYLLLPSYLLVLNILAILFFFLLIGTMYYFMQEVLIIFKEQHSYQQADDDMLYLIAYIFALANIPAMILNIISNLVALIFFDNLLVGICFALVFSLPILVLALYYPLKFFAYVSNDKASWRLMLELFVTSFITTCKENLGIKAMKDLLIDWRRV
ncbi:MAG: hypothetical protein HOA17_05125 [Candidatus Melainabacteria bacterium]|jgi:hypothetical protein|nr:hypothetical protein [Candidatus Melainabacteria bacterium]